MKGYEAKVESDCIHFLTVMVGRTGLLPVISKHSERALRDAG